MKSGVKVGFIENMINSTFENLPQRSIAYFLNTYPSFSPVQSMAATEEEQKNANRLIRNIYEKLFTDPMLMGLKITADDSLGDWEQQKVKPGLVPKIRGIIQKIEDFINILFLVSLSGKPNKDDIIIGKSDIQIKSVMLKQFDKFGIKTLVSDTQYIFTFPDNTTNGLVLLAKISKENTKPPTDGKEKPFLLFSRGVFDVKAPFTQEVFGNMLDDRTAFDYLITFLNENGYQRIDNKEFNIQISLDYIKNYGNPDEKLKWAWAERTRSGIEVIYDETRKNQPLFSLRVPYFDDLLKQSDKMNNQVKNFIINTSKKCNNCRYCIQTDKTGKRPLIFIKVDGYKICPLFCGFQYRWKSLNHETVKNMIEMLKFIDEVFKERICTK